MVLSRALKRNGKREVNELRNVYRGVLGTHADNQHNGASLIRHLVSTRLGADNVILRDIVGFLKGLFDLEAVLLELALCNSGAEVLKILHLYLADTHADLYSDLGAYLDLTSLGVLLIEYLILRYLAPLLLGNQRHVLGILGLSLVPGHSDEVRHEVLVAVVHAHRGAAGNACNGADLLGSHVQVLEYDGHYKEHCRDNERGSHCKEYRDKRGAALLVFVLVVLVVLVVVVLFVVLLRLGAYCLLAAVALLLGSRNGAVKILCGAVRGVVLIFENNARIRLEFLKILYHLAGSLVTLRGILLHSAEHDLLQTLRDSAVDLGGLLRGALHVHERDGNRRIAVERLPAGEHFVKRYADGIDVAALVGDVAARLLRADVVHRTDGLF